MILKHTTRRWMTLPTVVLVACSTDPGDDGESSGRPERVEISSQGAALTAQENTEAALRGVLNAGAFLAESTTMAESLSSVAGSSSESCYTEAVPCADCESGVLYEEVCDVEEEEVTTADLEEARQDMHDALDELLSFLREDVFTPDNLESEDATEAVYLLPASILCDDEDSGADPGSSPVVTPDGQITGDVVAIEAEAEEGESCEESVERLQPRLRLSSPGEGDVDVDFLLTDERRNPMSFQLYTDRVGVTVDLGELKATVEAAGEDLEGVQELDGEVGLELVRNSATNYSLRLNVLRDLVVAGGDADETVELMVAASSPTMELNVDGDAKALTGTINYGAINVAAPLSAFMDDEEYDEAGNLLPPKTYTGMIDAVLGGLNGSLTFDGTTDVLTLENLGLGDVSTTVSHDGNTLISVDVNPDDGRRFDLQIEEGEVSPTLTFSPTLDVRLGLGFTHIADQVDDIPTAFLDDTIRLWFEGNEPSVEFADAGLKVASGTLHLESASENVSVESGMCLVESASDEEPSSLAGAFEAGVCE